MLCCIISACKSPEKKTAEASQQSPNQQAPTLKPVEQDTLLNIVKQLAENMSARHYDVTEAEKLVKSYTSRYKINAAAAGRPFNNDKDYLSIYFFKNERDTSKIFFCRLLIPQPLFKKLTFNAFKQQFGNWEKQPPNTTPHEAPYIITSFKIASAPGVNLAVDSKNKPDYSENSIEQIEISSATL